MYFSLFLSFSSAQLWVPVISAWAKPASRSVSTSTTWIWRTSQTRPCVSRLPPVRFRQDRTSCLYSLLMNSRPTNINVLNVHSWWWWKRESGGGGRGGREFSLYENHALSWPRKKRHSPTVRSHVYPAKGPCRLSSKKWFSKLDPRLTDLS